MNGFTTPSLLTLMNQCGDIADLSAAVTHEPVFAGLPLAFTIRVTNAGPDISDVIVQFGLPPLPLLDVTPSSGSCFLFSSGNSIQ